MIGLDVPGEGGDLCAGVSLTRVRGGGFDVEWSGRGCVRRDRGPDCYLDPLSAEAARPCDQLRFG